MKSYPEISDSVILVEWDTSKCRWMIINHNYIISENCDEHSIGTLYNNSVENISNFLKGEVRNIFGDSVKSYDYTLFLGDLMKVTKPTVHVIIQKRAGEQYERHVGKNDFFIMRLIEP